ncbi:DUF4328 domain-containing protein [Streptomyces sp. NPDC050508]
MKPSWAVGGWFVPFVNLWYPRRITGWAPRSPGTPTRRTGSTPAPTR